jgi:hypothetical protein
MSVSLRHPVTGQIKVQPEGWSWSCFFGGFIGGPLFTRGLHVWGAVMVVFDMTYLIIQFVPGAKATALENWMYLAWIGLSFFFGMRANAMAIDHHLNNGWEFADQRLELLRSGSAPRHRGI